MGGYQETYDRWKRDPEAFWRELAGRIEWEREPDVVLDSEQRAACTAGSPAAG